MKFYRALRYDLSLAALAFLTFGWRGAALAVVLRGLTTSLYNQALAIVAEALAAPSEPSLDSPEE